VLAVIYIRGPRTISRLEGGVAVALYALFLAVTVARA
jgi:hypothetical protein